jgi:hypothetical protein
MLRSVSIPARDFVAALAGLLAGQGVQPGDPGCAARQLRSRQRRPAEIRQLDIVMILRH